MWISNTASVLALLPVAMAIPPNLIFASVYETFSGEEFGFMRWMTYGVPITVLGLPMIALWLTRGLKLDKPVELKEVGEFTVHEKRALLVFGIVVALWVLRGEPLGGWMNWFNLPLMVDATVALAGVVVMFLVPNGKGGRLLTWERAVSIPWGVLLLFAGGICLAAGFMESGLSDSIGNALAALTVLPLWLLVLLLALTVSLLTNVTSNTATATLLMPILASTAMASGLPLEILMIPVVVACTCAFCLPVATALNSIVFASNMVTIKQVTREGIVPNILMAVIIAVVVLFVAP